MKSSTLPFHNHSKLCGLLGILFLGLSGMGLFYDLKATLQSYLFSFLFWSDFPIGAIPLLMIAHLTGGAWSEVSKQALKVLSNTIPWIALFSLPILFGIHSIYPWTLPQIAMDPKVHHKHVYLNPVSFSLRTLFYFLVWILLNALLQRCPTRSLQKWSAGGLVLVGFITTFASIDWQMSIEPKWYSTIYGLVFATGSCLSSFSLGLVSLKLLHPKGSPISPHLTKKTLRDLGNILLTLVMVWTYLSFMQYLIIWSGNLPHEVPWFIHRTQGGWQWLALILVVFQFFVPFLLLLFRSSKDHFNRLAGLGLLILLVRMVDHYWMLVPGLNPHRFEIPWQIITTWLGLGGVFLTVLFKNLAKNFEFQGDRRA